MRSCLVCAVAPRPDGAADSAAVLAAVQCATGVPDALPAHYELIWHAAKKREDEAEEDARFTVLLSCSLKVLEMDPETEGAVTAAIMSADVVAEVRGGRRDRLPAMKTPPAACCCRLRALHLAMDRERAAKKKEINVRDCC